MGIVVGNKLAITKAPDYPFELIVDCASDPAMYIPIPASIAEISVACLKSNSL
jgi:hypothetical protein